VTTALARALTQDEIATLRHDLRTPVNHIVGYCELLLEDSDGAEYAGRREKLHGSLRAVREALDMINTTLAPGGRDVTQSDVDALYEQLRGPHSRIMQSMAALLAPAEHSDDADEFSADVRKIQHATEQLLAVRRPESGQRSGAVSATGPTTASNPVPPSATAHSTGRGTILVVDDEPNNCSVLERQLVRQGYGVVCLGDGASALDAVRKTSYDVMLLDVRMPGTDGREVLRSIKQDPATRDLPVVMISAADDLSIIAACIEAGADDFLPKPFDPVILRARVSASIEKKRLRNLEVDYLHQVERVAEAAAAVERGTYEAGSLAQVAERGDALGRLARVFDSMAAGVKAREQRLQDHVANLRHEMDEARRSAVAAADVQPDDGALIPGELFANRYQIVRVIGRGGMGMVYKARDRELAEDVAIKMLRGNAMGDDPTAVERFKTEIRLARRISHRNVVRTHDLGESGGAYYVTMEYVEGITVRDLIDMRGHLSVPSTLGIAQQLAVSLQVAHEQGVIHRDIKPQNMLLDADGVLKVMDFGIARLTQSGSTLTQAGMVIGTPAYMSPEQLLAEEVDARSDLYAVGVVLYECLTGVLPFEAASPIALIAKVLHTVPITPAERDGSVPLPLSGLVMRLLDKEPGGRPGSARELRELLAELG
jgi:CheY-like chemotaxis protein